MNTTRLADAFLKYRAELFPMDVWGDFIVPPFFNRVSIFKGKQSLRIQGGRGCGKTMFIRYLCHDTRFSKKRSNISVDEFGAIGLYWRPDTQFCKLMSAAWVGEPDSDLAFIHYATLILLGELCGSFENIAAADIQGGPYDILNHDLPTSVQQYLGNRVTKISDLKEFSDSERSKLELWIQNPSQARPTMLRFDSIFESIIESLSKSDPRLKNLFFRIFIDEFENLQESQRRLICDSVKHPKTRFNVSFAMRQFSVSNFRTSGSEQIVEGHDIRTIDLERELNRNSSKDFTLLASEFLLLKLTDFNSSFLEQFSPFSPEELFDINFLAKRDSNEYRSAILANVRKILPALSSKDIASIVFSDKSLLNRLSDLVGAGLKLHGEKKLSKNDFLDPSHPEASIVAAAILNRPKPGPNAVHNELIKLSAPEPTSSTLQLSGDLIGNNLYGVLFFLYIGLPRRSNLLYSGFDRFCMLSSSNLRFFQELCHVAFQLKNEQQRDIDESNAFPMVPAEIQATAADQVSETFLLEIEHLGLQGSKLLEIVRRLGRIFSAAHKRPSQSEVEINHFSINESDRLSLTEEAKDLINQGKIWSIFFEEQDTKNKSPDEFSQTDIIPNPIFSPYFRISYRKKKKLTLSATEVNTIMTGTGAQFDAILQKYSKKWQIDPSDLTPTQESMF